MNVSKRLRSILKSDRGNVMIVAAACMPIVIGAAAIGVDSIQLTLAKRELQRAADSAALAGAYAIVQSKTPADAVDRDLTLNNRITLSTTRTVENPTTWGSPSRSDTHAVRVALTASRSTPFWGYFSHSSTTVSVEAKAAYVYLGEFCMVSLTNDTSTGVTFQGNTTMNLGCGVESNSKGTTAVSAGGSSSVTASPIAAVGGVPSSGSYASGTTLLPYSPPLSDPFSYLPRTPTPPSDCVRLNLNPQGNQSISWGTLGASRSYCIVGSTNGNNDAKIQTNVTFPDNVTVYVQGGTLDIGPATVSGTHVSFVLTTPPNNGSGSVATMSMNANAVLNLTAQDTGTYAGVLFYQDPRVTSGSTTTINGNSGATLKGAFYFPNGDLTFNGNAGMTITCLQLVALHLSFSGNSTITNSCPSTGTTGAKSFAGYFVKLVA